MNFCLKTAPLLKLIEISTFYYPKEPVIFPYLRQYYSTPSLINNPDTDSHLDTFLQFSQVNNQSVPDTFQTQTSTKDVSQDSTPKYQNFSHSPSLNDHLDKTLASTDSDFEISKKPNLLFKLI